MSNIPKGIYGTVQGTPEVKRERGGQSFDAAGKNLGLGPSANRHGISFPGPG